MKPVSRYFLNGLIVTVPIAITILVVNQIFSLADKLLGQYLPIYFPGLSLIIVLVTICMVGWLSSNWILRRIFLFAERMVDTIPIVKFIYSIVKQISTAMLESKQLFKNAVLVPYPHPGCKVLGFVMSPLSEPLKEKLDVEYVCIFIPMSFNMTAGFNIMVRKDDVIPLEVTSESALQYILTAGAMMPRSNDVTKC